MSELDRRIERFLFARANPFKVAIFRIITGLFISVLFYQKLNDKAEEIFYFESEWVIELYEHIILTPAYFSICWIFIIAFTIGLFPRISNGAIVVLLAPLLIVDLSHFRSFYIICFSTLCFFFLYHSEYLSIYKRVHYTQKNQVRANMANTVNPNFINCIIFCECRC